MKRLILLILLVIIAITAIIALTGCTKDKNTNLQSDTQPTELTFKFEVTYKDGSTDEFDITTAETNLAEALLSEGLVEGDVGQYGLFVTAVNGAAIEDTNAYWELLVDGESSMAGASSVEIEPGITYAFKYATF